MQKSLSPRLWLQYHTEIASARLATARCALTFKNADDIGNFLQMFFHWKNNNFYFPYFWSTCCFDPKLSNGNISRFVLFMDLFFSRCSAEKGRRVCGTGCDFRCVFTLLLMFISRCPAVVLPSTNVNIMQLKSIFVYVCVCISLTIPRGYICTHKWDKFDKIFLRCPYLWKCWINKVNVFNVVFC